MQYSSLNGNISTYLLFFKAPVTGHRSWAKQYDSSGDTNHWYNWNFESLKINFSGKVDHIASVKV